MDSLSPRIFRTTRTRSIASATLASVADGCLAACADILPILMAAAIHGAACADT